MVVWEGVNEALGDIMFDLEVSSSNFPLWDRNPNTGHEIGADAELRPALQTVFHDSARPSRLVLPVIPADEGRGKQDGR